MIKIEGAKMSKKSKNGISRTENGEISSHQDAKQRMDKWL
jgi:hypothetical protein